MPSDRAGNVAGILLAAGTSSRMGSNKLLFDLQGETVLRQAAKRALAGGLSPVGGVLGHESEKAPRGVEGLAREGGRQPPSEQGINTPLKSGVRGVRGVKAPTGQGLAAD